MNNKYAVLFFLGVIILVVAFVAVGIRLPSHSIGILQITNSMLAKY
jgi:hypothetical protein